MWFNGLKRTRARGIGITALIMLALTLILSAVSPGSAQAAHDTGPDQVYFSETGHTLQGDFLDHWRHKGGLPLFGYPLTEEFANPATGVITQYFERAVFELHPDNPAEWRVLLYRLGVTLTEGHPNPQPFQPHDAANNANCTFYAETGHFLCNGFRDYWKTYGGLPTFGYPLSEEFQEKNLDTGEVYTVQYFERARFEWHPENAGTVYEVLLGRLGADAANRDKVDQTPVAQPEDVPSYDPGLWKKPTPPPPPVPTGAPTWNAKWIEVNLSTQYMRAWEYGTPVLGTAISSGKAGYPTPTGYFTVYYKLRYDDMTSGPGVPLGEYYYVEDVPHVMYFAAGGYAIHGAYWHNMFGTPYSRGCVSTPLWAAEWFYNWTPYGTTVWVHW